MQNTDNLQNTNNFHERFRYIFPNRILLNNYDGSKHLEYIHTIVCEIIHKEINKWNIEIQKEIEQKMQNTIKDLILQMKSQLKKEIYNDICEKISHSNKSPYTSPYLSPRSLDVSSIEEEAWEILK